MESEQRLNCIKHQGSYNDSYCQRQPNPAPITKSISGQGSKIYFWQAVLADQRLPLISLNKQKWSYNIFGDGMQCNSCLMLSFTHPDSVPLEKSMIEPAFLKVYLNGFKINCSALLH